MITNLFRRDSVLLFELVVLLLFPVFAFHLLAELEGFVQHFLLTYLALEVEIVAAVVPVALVVVLADFVAVAPLAFVLLVVS